MRGSIATYSHRLLSMPVIFTVCILTPGLTRVVIDLLPIDYSRHSLD